MTQKISVSKEQGRIAIVLNTDEGRPYTAIEAVFPEPGKPYIGIHRRSQERGSTKCALLERQCEFDVEYPQEFPIEEREQVRVLVGKLHQLHPSMVPRL